MDEEDMDTLPSQNWEDQRNHRPILKRRAGESEATSRPRAEFPQPRPKKSVRFSSGPVSVIPREELEEEDISKRLRFTAMEDRDVDKLNRFRVSHGARYSGNGEESAAANSSQEAGASRATSPEFIEEDIRQTEPQWGFHPSSSHAQTVSSMPAEYPRAIENTSFDFATGSTSGETTTAAAVNATLSSPANDTFFFRGSPNSSNTSINNSNALALNVTDKGQVLHGKNEMQLATTSHGPHRPDATLPADVNRSVSCANRGFILSAIPAERSKLGYRQMQRRSKRKPNCTVAPNSNNNSNLRHGSNDNVCVTATAMTPVGDLQIVSGHDATGSLSPCRYRRVIETCPSSLHDYVYCIAKQKEQAQNLGSTSADAAGCKLCSICSYAFANRIQCEPRLDAFYSPSSSDDGIGKCNPTGS